jgi:heptosyltransferase-2
MNTAEHILVVGPAWVGDMVMAQSLFMTLKQTRDNPRIDVLAPDWSLPLLQRMPQVHQAISLPVAHGELGLLKRRTCGRRLQATPYTQAIVLPRSFKAALVPFFAGIPRRTGYRGEWRYGLLNDVRRLDKTVLRQTVQRYVALGLAEDAALPPPIPAPSLRIDAANQQRLLRELGLQLDRPAIAMMPGAEYGPAKRWPTEYFRQVAQALVAQGRQVWVLGSAKEAALGDEIAAGEGMVNLCGRTQLEDVVDLLSCCAGALSNDSGLMHVACASGVPVIAIYGSSDPAYTPPLSEQAHILYQGMACSPCFARTCRFGHYNCLKHIRPQEVTGVILEQT